MAEEKNLIDSLEVGSLEFGGKEFCSSVKLTLKASLILRRFCNALSSLLGLG